MKKALAILIIMILGITMLAACGGGGSGSATGSGASTAAIVGEWEYEFGGYVYEFKEDGTGTYTVGSDSVMNFTYKEDGKTLSLLYDGMSVPTEFEYTLDGDTLNIKDSFGSDAIYKKK